MLQKLSISNYALIDDLEIVFDKGLNILTGETGAGKSIVLGALSLILGQRAESRYFFNQQKKCIIEGLFKIGEFHLKSFFEDPEKLKEMISSFETRIVHFSSGEYARFSFFSKLWLDRILQMFKQRHHAFLTSTAILPG